jgi:hypothetical protein
MGISMVLYTEGKGKMLIANKKSKIIKVIASAVLLAGCLAQPVVTSESSPTLAAAPGLALASPTPQPTQTPTATEIPATATQIRPPTDTPIPPTDWSNIRCVPKSPEDIARCPQSPSPVTEKDNFIDWFASWAKQMDAYKPGPSVAYGFISIDPDGSQHYILTITNGGLAGTFWFTGDTGQKVLVMAMANGIFDSNKLYRGQYNLIALVDKTSYKGVIGAGISQADEINCLQPNAVVNVTTLNMADDANHYLEKAVAENFPNGVLADASTLRAGFIWMYQKY